MIAASGWFPGVCGIMFHKSVCPEGSIVIGEHRAKALFAGGVALFVTGLVVLMLFVVPAARHSQVAMAQEPPPPEDADAGAYPGPAEPGGYPGPGEGAMPGPPGAEMGGEMGAAPGGAGGAAKAAEPLEPSRPNPFAPRSAIAVAEGPAVVTATTYGPDWSRLPLGERVGFVLPEIPPAPTPPLPSLGRAPEEAIRITSILWDASGGAQAAYEDSDGKTGTLRPGDRIQGFTVMEITRSGVLLENPRSGERQQLELRPRAEKKPEPRPQRGGRGTTTGGRRPTGGGQRPAFPGAPPG